jgi:hypothetical protein
MNATSEPAANQIVSRFAVAASTITKNAKSPSHTQTIIKITPL